MANPLDSNCGGAATIERSIVEDTVEPPAHGKLQSSKGSGGSTPGDTVSALDTSENHVVFVPGQEGTRHGVVEDSDAYCSVSSNKPKMVVPEIEEQTSDKKKEVKAQCSEKCVLKIQYIDDAELTEPSLIINEKFNNDCNGTKNGELQEKKQKKPNRRGGKARRQKHILECYSIEKKEKKGHQYSRKVMEALRFQELEEQKKRWVEVYCGLGPLVSKEYDGLAELDKVPQKHSVPNFDFDPRPQFQKSVKLRAPDFDSGPPQDGLEYLRRVRWETARIPKVTVAKVNKIKEQSPYMPQIPDIMKCPENLLPLKQWEDSFLADFSELRLAFMRLDPQCSSGTSSIKVECVGEGDILGQMVESNISDKFVAIASNDDSCVLETSDAKVNPQSPENSGFTIDSHTLSTILNMDSAARTSMLKRQIRSIENMATLSRDDSIWLFALCVAIDCPLDADTSAALRSLLRKCASLRAGKEQVDDEVVILNILVTIIGKYFGQLECGKD